MEKWPVLLKLSVEEVSAIDRVRGGVSRTAWIRGLCAAAVEASDGLGRAGSLRVVVDDGDAWAASPGVVESAVVVAPRPRRSLGVMGVSPEVAALAGGGPPVAIPGQITVDEALAS
jgi:hypothetical protein